MNNQMRKGGKKARKRRTSIRQQNFGFLLENGLFWVRFSWERSDKMGRERLVLALRNGVSFNLEAPWSDEDAVRTICQKVNLPIKLLSEQLKKTFPGRDRTVFGASGDKIDRIARNYDGMYWWFSDGGLVMDTVSWTPPQDFDYLVGKKLVEMRQSTPRRNLSKEQYIKLAAELDALGRFTPLAVLTAKGREALRDWNQKNSSRAITTFEQAIYAKQPTVLHEELFTKFYRAEEKFKRQKFR